MAGGKQKEKRGKGVIVELRGGDYGQMTQLVVGMLPQEVQLTAQCTSHCNVILIYISTACVAMLVM